MIRSLLILAVVFAGSGCSPRLMGDDAACVDSPLEKLCLDVENQAVASVRILHVPYFRLTRTAVTPENIEDYAESKLQLTLDPPGRARLAGALRAETGRRTTAVVNLRWGAIFYNQRGEVLHTMFVSGKSWMWKGRQGIVDSESVTLNGSFVHWLEDESGRSG